MASAARAAAARIGGFATPAATAAFAARCQSDLGVHASAYSILAPAGLTISSIGVGTYQGDIGPEHDKLVVEAIVEAVRNGVNVIDTAVNYRLQQGERCVGQALRQLLESGVSREELFVSTKAGFVPGDYELSMDKEEGQKKVAANLVEAGVPAEAICEGFKHTLHPAALEYLFSKSLENLGLEAVDLFYLHNAENELGMGVPLDVLLARIADAFVWCEQMCASQKIRAYGLATWDCFRVPPGDGPNLQFSVLKDLAQAAALKVHGEGRPSNFTFSQIPLNLGKTEAMSSPTQKSGEESMVPALSWCSSNGVDIFSSSSLGGGGELPEGVAEALDKHAALDGIDPGKCRQLEFARSTPGICCALVGMKRPTNVAANAALLKRPRLTNESFKALVNDLFPSAL